MITQTDMLYLYVETLLHAGVGSGLSSIDLPIQRERATQYPMIQGSSIKGKLRATAEDHNELKKYVDIIFGPGVDPGKGSEHAGALAVGDARILLFPVRSLNGVFAYTTSYDVLGRFQRDFERGNVTTNNPLKVPDDTKKVLRTTTSDIHTNNKMVLEEFSFDAQTDESGIVDALANWLAEHALPYSGENNYWKNRFRRSLVILPNDDFRDFALYATEVVTRIRLDRKTKTVERGQLWTEEHLPADTLLYVPLYASDSRKNGNGASPMEASEILQKVRKLENNRGGYIQLGGDETVGRGMVRLHWSVNTQKQ